MNPLDHPVVFSYPQRIVESGWLEHVPFGLFVIDLVRPRLLVELGTHNGVSYCAFCQAVRELGSDTRCYAIDTWQGDPQSGFYGEEVLAHLRQHHDPLYGSFSRLVQSTFDEALEHFEDGSVDLLHIDGYHTYDAVKHDWQTWLPKMSERGVVLLHDISVREGDFGVWKLWEELATEYQHFEFPHGHGLGLLAVGEEVPGRLSELLDARGQDVSSIRDFFYQLGMRLTLQRERQRSVEELTAHVEETQSAIRALTAQIGDNERYAAELVGQIGEKDQYAAELTAQLAEKDRDVAELTLQVHQQTTCIEEMSVQANEHIQAQRSLETQSREKDLAARKLIDDLQLREHEVDSLTEQITTWNQHWTGVQQTLAWAVVVRLRGLRQLFAPKQSRRERLWFAAFRRARGVTSIRRGKDRALEAAERDATAFKDEDATVTTPTPGKSGSTRDPNYASHGVEVLANAKLQAFLTLQQRMVFPWVAEPRVSIVIPLWNQAFYTYMTLESLLANDAQVSFEVILVDNGSTDETAQLLRRIEGVQSHVNQSNLGFGIACSQGADLARGQYVCFLNNDTILTPGWLGALVRAVEEDPARAAAGARLVSPDKTLQEAGGIIWEDGSCLGYGRGEDAFAPEYSYLREVDYCSAACLLVRRDVFQAVGGFDPRYSPAYYEDLDLCMAIVEAGHKVVYAPQATIFHVEHGSTDRTRAVTLQLRNREIFVKKWKGALSGRGLPGQVSILRQRDARPAHRILFMDDRVPEQWIGSGFPRTRAMLDALVQAGYAVTYLPTTDRHPYQPTTAELQNVGIEVLYDVEDVKAKLLERATLYDAVLVSRPHNAALIDVVLQANPCAAVIYDAEAVFTYREAQQAALEGHPLSLEEIETRLRAEMALVAPADLVLAVSPAEAHIFETVYAHLRAVVWGHAIPIRALDSSFEARRDLVFVGYLGSGPNNDAALHFLTQIFPAVRQNLSCRLLLVGRDASKEVAAAASSLDGAVSLEGFVEDLGSTFRYSRVFIAPHRFAGGIPLKVVEAMSYGVPCVVSKLLAEQLGVTDGVEALVANDAEDFVRKVIQLYGDEQLWTHIQTRALDFVRKHYDPSAMRILLEKEIERCLAEKQAVTSPTAISAGGPAQKLLGSV